VTEAIIEAINHNAINKLHSGHRWGTIGGRSYGNWYSSRISTHQRVNIN